VSQQVAAKETSAEKGSNYENENEIHPDCSAENTVEIEIDDQPNRNF
jgi:hypothetical protein